MSDSSEPDTKKKKASRRLSSNYQEPEYITVDVHDAVTQYENGKPIYTTYKITTIVRLHYKVTSTMIR